MNQIAQGITMSQYSDSDKDRLISFSFPLKGYGKLQEGLSVMKKIYRESFLHDFQRVLTSRVD
jgi:hypothetical protein